MRHVAVESAAVHAEFVQTLPWKEASESECGVQTRGAMSLAHDEPVAARPIGFVGAHPQDASIQAGQQLSAGEDRADVRRVGTGDHPQRRQPNVFGELRKLGFLQ